MIETSGRLLYATAIANSTLDGAGICTELRNPASSGIIAKVYGCMIGGTPAESVELARTGNNASGGTSTASYNQADSAMSAPGVSAYFYTLHPTPGGGRLVVASAYMGNGLNSINVIPFAEGIGPENQKYLTLRPGELLSLQVLTAAMTAMNLGWVWEEGPA